MFLLWVALLVMSCNSVAEQKPSFVYLGSVSQAGPALPLLQREIVRQAVAMVCREELGLICRDAVLGDPVPEQSALHLEFLISRDFDKPSLVLHLSGSTNELWRQQFDSSNYAVLLASAEKEAFTRLKDRLPQARGVIVSADETLKTSQADSASLPDLFELLRKAHVLHTRAGAAPATYEALIRGYANLGELTSHAWNASYKVYQARALLYAQQFVRTHPESAQAYFLRAYAFGLCGLHSHALDDLATGKAMAGDAVPEWVALLENLLYFRTEALLGIANGNGPYCYTAGTMALMTLEYTPFSSRIFAAYEALENKPPVDIRALAQLNDAGGVSSLHETTVEGFHQMSYLTQQVLPAQVLLPEVIRTQLPPLTFRDSIQNLVNSLDRQPNKWPALVCIPNLYRTLNSETAAGKDTGEPSLAAFGDLLRENIFVLAAWRQHFMNDKWSVGIGEFTREVLPYIEGHRYQNLLAAYSAKRHQSEEEYLALLKTVQPADLPAGAHLFLTAFFKKEAVYGPIEGSVLSARYLDCLDQTHSDLQRSVSLTQDKTKKENLGEQILKVSPFSPYGRRIQLTYKSDWKLLFKQYEKDGPLCPELAQIVAWQYQTAKEYEQAIPYYEQAAMQIEESYVYRALADCYLKAGNQEQWLKTMERALTLPDYKLDHANTQTTVARHFMQVGDIKKARPYAEAAAESYAQWALSLAGECAMAAGDLPRAQKLLKDEAERYAREDVVPWETYCKALIFQIPSTEAWFQKVSEKITRSLNSKTHTRLEDFFCGFYHWRAKQFDAAAGCFSEAFHKSPDVWYSILEALVWLEKGDQKRHIEKLNEIINDFDSTKDKSSSRKQIRMLAILMKKHAEGRHVTEALYTDLLSMKKEGSLYPADFFFFTGKYLALVGQEEAAIQFFYKGIEPGQIDRWAGPFPFLELQDRGLNPFARYTNQIPEYHPVR